MTGIAENSTKKYDSAIVTDPSELITKNTVSPTDGMDWNVTPSEEEIKQQESFKPTSNVLFMYGEEELEQLEKKQQENILRRNKDDNPTSSLDDYEKEDSNDIYCQHEYMSTDKNSTNIEEFCYKKISLNTAYEMLQENLNTPLPEGSIMFPWLHLTNTSTLSLEKNTHNLNNYTNEARTPLSKMTNPITGGECNEFIKKNISIIRCSPYDSTNMSSFNDKNTAQSTSESTMEVLKYVENSGILMNSLDASDLFLPYDEYSHDLYYILESEYSLSQLKIESEQEFQEMYEYCLKTKILPILRIDDIGQSQYALQNGKKKSKNAQGAGLSDLYKHGHEPKLFRRFDIQQGKMLQMSSKILTYCFNNKEHISIGSNVTTENGTQNTKTKKTCNCVTLLKLLKMSLQLNFQRSNYKFNNSNGDNITREFYVIDIPSPHITDHPLIGTPLLSCHSLNKKKDQLVSEFDATVLNDWEKDLYYREKLEVSKMSSASPINKLHNLWCGNSIDYEISRMKHKKLRKIDESGTKKLDYFKLENSICNLKNLDIKNYQENDSLMFNLPSVDWTYYIHCENSFQRESLNGNNAIMNEELYHTILNNHRNTIISNALGTQKDNENKGKEQHTLPSKHLRFPASGSIGLGSLSLLSIKMIFQFIDLIYELSQPISLPGSGSDSKSHKLENINKTNILIYSTDGYTETSFLTVAYTIYTEHMPLDDAIAHLHSVYNRPIFLFPSDLQVLIYLQKLLLDKSPNNPNRSSSKEISDEEFTMMFFTTDISKNDLLPLKGPLPSRILDYLYLGSLKHAENCRLLKKLGINCIISVGEKMDWVSTYGSSENSIIKQDGFTILHINDIADNGKDPLIHMFSLILDFIEEQKNLGNKILIHCMVGVSRSATVVIAECMKSFNMDILKAYIYVRVRRLNIIIQPNLMFMYELLKFEELLNTQDPTRRKTKRSINWQILCKTISELNGNYIDT